MERVEEEVREEAWERWRTGGMVGGSGEWVVLAAVMERGGCG